MSEWGPSDTDQDIQVLEDEILFESILQVINNVAPNNIFNRGKSERKRRKKTKKRLKAAVSPHLFPMWQNVDDLISPTETASVSKPIVEVMSPYPIIDMSKVNKRFMSNLPEPEPFPVLCCSQDPNFYEPKYEAQNVVSTVLSNHNEKKTFGIAFGFETNLEMVGWDSREGAIQG